MWSLAKRTLVPCIAGWVALTWTPPAAAQGITNGGFEQPGPNGNPEPSASGWKAGQSDGDRPKAEPGGAAGSAGRMRIGDDPATPAEQFAPYPSAIGQSFKCADPPDAAKWCRVEFQSAFARVAADAGEDALVVLQVGDRKVTKMIPADAKFTPHSLAVQGCDAAKIYFLITKGDVEDAVTSTLYLDDVRSSCVTERPTGDLEDPPKDEDDTAWRVASRWLDRKIAAEERRRHYR